MCICIFRGFQKILTKRTSFQRFLFIHENITFGFYVNLTADKRKKKKVKSEMGAILLKICDGARVCFKFTNTFVVGISAEFFFFFIRLTSILLLFLLKPSLIYTSGK